MADTQNAQGKGPAVLQQILRRTAAPTDYASRNVRTDAELKHLAAVSKALEDVPQMVRQSNDELAQRFIDIAEQAAKALEQLGDSSLQDGQRRHDEYYRLAQATRHKGAYQAKETLGYLKGIGTIKDVSAEAHKPAIVLPVEEESIEQPPEEQTFSPAPAGKAG